MEKFNTAELMVKQARSAGRNAFIRACLTELEEGEGLRMVDIAAEVAAKFPKPELAPKTYRERIYIAITDQYNRLNKKAEKGGTAKLRKFEEEHGYTVIGR